MHKSFFLRRCTASRSVGLAILFLPSPLLPGAQHRDSTARRAKADSLRADSIRVADSLAIVRELEGKGQGETSWHLPCRAGGCE
ncbi:MAG: hypothetical protein IPN47_00015 [Gemmatimonadetes bacterium]|nr:hypothetical protein [Gemmatimonadota bacterium]